MSKLFTYKSAALLVALSLTAAVRSNAQQTSTTSGAVFVMTNSSTRNEICNTHEIRMALSFK
jgi:hypothetical protein